MSESGFFADIGIKAAKPYLKALIHSYPVAKGMDWDTDRRRFLEIAGVSAMLPFAGCNSQQTTGEPAAGETDRVDTTTTTSSQTDTEQTTTAPQTASGDTATVALAIHIDQEALDKHRTELQKKLQNGTINRTEAQRQFSSFRENLITDAVKTFRNQTKNNPSLTVNDAVSQVGILLVSGTPASLIETLSNKTVRGLFPQTTFQQAKLQAQTGGR